MRRLPVYILIDTSGSMNGEPIESVKVGLEAMVSSLRSDPYALETVWISIITFDRDVKILMPMTPLENMQIPQIEVPQSGPTMTGAALETLLDCMKRDIRHTTPEEKGDWMPMMFLLTDGKPSDTQLYQEIAPKIRNTKFAAVIACAAGPKAKTEPLAELTDKVFSLDTLDSSSFRKFFTWVSDTIGSGNKSIGATDSLTLPPPPDEVNLVI